MRSAANGWRIRMTHFLGPLVPAGLVAFRERAECGELLETATLFPDERIEFRRVAALHAHPDSLQRAHLQPEHRVAVDYSILVEGAGAGSDR